MKEKGSNKILIVIIIILSVIIVGLAVAIGIVALSDSDKKQSSDENEAIETTAIETVIPETTTPAFDATQYATGIYMENGQTEDDKWSDGGVMLEITAISETNVSFTYKSISSPPANRIAEIQVVDAEIVDGKADFTFDNDEWFNRGKGYIQFLPDGQIEIKTEITRRDSEAMWDIGELKHTLTFVQ